MIVIKYCGWKPRAGKDVCHSLGDGPAAGEPSTPGADRPAPHPIAQTRILRLFLQVLPLDLF
jgi:hypothetical protein